MNAVDIRDIDPLDVAAEAALVALNNAHAEETSFLETADWRALVAAAYAARRAGDAAALLLAFDETAAYDGVNYRWFRERNEKFVYVDRVIVGARHRGAGLARALYEDLFQRLRASRHSVLGCEVNVAPPNPGSEAFHAKLGFREVGRADLEDRGKRVVYLLKDLA